MTRSTTPTTEARIGEVVRRLRERQGLSLRTLATRAGFSASFLSQLENGQVSPSINSLDRLAAELGVTLAALFEASQEPAAVVIRAGRRPGFTSSWSKARIEALVEPGAPRPFEALCITLAPRGASGRAAAIHGADQFAYVLQGTIVLFLAEQRHELAVGDSVVIPKGQPHRWENGSSSDAQILFVSARSPA